MFLHATAWVAAVSWRFSTPALRQTAWNATAAGDVSKDTPSVGALFAPLSVFGPVARPNGIPMFVAALPGRITAGMEKGRFGGYRLAPASRITIPAGLVAPLLRRMMPG